MKQIYQKPETELIVVSTIRMIAASNPEDGFNTSNVPESDPGQTSGNLSRRRTVWDDDEAMKEEDQY
jgi:hypothetical protein